MEENYKYYVIGGLHADWCFGGADTLAEAKKIADDHVEYFDEYYCFRKPAIFRAEDTEVIVANSGTPCYREGAEYRVPVFGAEPIVPHVVWDR